MKNKSTRGAATKQRILEAAAALMDKQGYNGTSVDDVLAAAGAGKSQFYHYFSSKTQLAKEILQLRMQGAPLGCLLNESTTNIECLPDLLARLDGLVASHRAGAFPHGCPIGNIAAELAGAHAELRAEAEAIFGAYASNLTAILRRLSDKQQVEKMPPAAAIAQSVMAAVQGGLLLAKVAASSEPFAQVIDQVKLSLMGTAGTAQTDVRSTQRRIGGSGNRLAVPRQPLSYCP